VSPTTAALVLSWICIVLLALGTAGLLRRVDALERAQSGAPGTPEVPAGPRAGLRLPMERFVPVDGDRDVLLLVVSPACGSCRSALADLADLAAAQPTGLDVVVVTAEPSLGALAPPPGFAVLTDAGELVETLGVPATPYLVRLDADGTIRRADVATGSTNLATWTAPRTPLTTLVEER
jgi:hypothetical protein